MRPLDVILIPGVTYNLEDGKMDHAMEKNIRKKPNGSIHINFLFNITLTMII